MGNNEGVYLFVYGTLLQHNDNVYADLLIKNAIKLTDGFIYAKKYDLGNFPRIKIDPEKRFKTYGELLEITLIQIKYSIN
ncbi:gamma-glutamylcyclotransferase [Aquimarina agarivorans]|uniref:gamma-glutamylcyclotransferase n=1 Tax=Aquimarina agarivorans TaxID=980584 RepID=UPI000248E96F|nr:gamma-glutamylcyclotransferase [Aquimarina agarivorans]